MSHLNRNKRCRPVLRLCSNDLIMKTKVHLLFVMLLLAVTFLGLPATVEAKAVPDSLYRVEMQDGRVLVGEILEEDEEGIVLRVEGLGTIRMIHDDIKSIRKVVPDDNEVVDEQWIDNPNPTRYLFAPNALNLKRGSGYYQNTWIFFNNMNIGLTNHFSLGFGVIPLFLLGINETPVWLLPKFSIPVSESLHLGAGAMLGGILSRNNSTGAGITYGLATYGSKDRNVSMALGWGYQGGEFASRPVVNFSFIRRMSDNLYVLSENHFIPDTNASYQSLISLGARWAPERFSVDFALVRPGLVSTGGIIGIPWLGLTIPFGEGG